MTFFKINSVINSLSLILINLTIEKGFPHVHFPFEHSVVVCGTLFIAKIPSWRTILQRKHNTTKLTRCQLNNLKQDSTSSLVHWLESQNYIIFTCVLQRWILLYKPTQPLACLLRLWPLINLKKNCWKIELLIAKIILAQEPFELNNKLICVLGICKQAE